MSKTKKISTEEFDRLFDAGEDLTPYLDMSRARHPNLETKPINIELPQWMINALDQEAEHLGITRQSVIETMLSRELRKASL
jgi:hypothetical protein